MIPKTIHYCWFGRNPLPDSAQKCIASWRKFFPDYEIIEWNEDNFDVNSIPYTAEAYATGKYAFVSDYARFKILYDNGGLYFDTDVEIIKTMDDIIANGSFMGFEINPDGNNFCGAVNPGLGLGVCKNDILYKKILDSYRNIKFINPDGKYNLTTIVHYTTEILRLEGLSADKKIQKINGITIYPVDYFNPLNDNTGRLCITGNTRSIHWYRKTWLDVHPIRTQISRLVHRIFGVNMIPKIRKVFTINHD